MAEEKTIEQMKKDPKEIEAALKLLKQTREQRTKYAAKIKNDPEAKKRAAEASKKRRIEDRLLIEKAKKAGVTVAPAEVEKALKG